MERKTIFAEKSYSSQTVDTGFVISVILLLGFGLITLYASSVICVTNPFKSPSHYVNKQLIFTGIGLVLLTFFSLINLNFIRKLLPIIFIGTLVLCALTILPFIGLEKNGARRWFALPIIGSFQPSEFAKLAIIIIVAKKIEDMGGKIDSFKKLLIIFI